MTQRRRWLPLAALLLAFAATRAQAGEGASGCSTAPGTPTAVQEMPPCDGCPVLSKIPYLNRLFRNCAPDCESKCGSCPCKEEAKDGGCCCEKEKGDCPCKKSKAVKREESPVPCYPLAGMPVPPPPPMLSMPPMPPPMAYAPCPPVPYTPSMMAPYGQPVYMPAPPAARRYMVEVRVVESNPGEKDLVVASPKVAVTEGGSGCVSFVPPGVTAEEQAKLTVENNVYVMVRSAKPGWAYVEVAVEEVDREKTGKKGTGLVEYSGSIHIVRKVKLGKTVKVPWKESADDDKPVCRVELKVKEIPTPKTPSVVFDCPCNATWCEVCPSALPTSACYDLPAPAPIAQAAYSAPATMPAPCAASKCDRTVRYTCVDDCLRYFTSSSGMKLIVTIAKDTNIEMPGCKLKVFAAGNNRVGVRGGCMKAFADRVTACSDGNLTLEGNVRLKCADCKAAVRAEKLHVILRDGKVKIDLDPCKTSN